MSTQAQKVAARFRVAMDSDQEDLYNKLWMIASNDGDSYKKRDATGAVDKAWREWKKIEDRRLREDFRAIKKQMAADLKKRWGDKGE